VLLEALKLARGTTELGNRALIFAKLQQQTWRRKVSFLLPHRRVLFGNAVVSVRRGELNFFVRSLCYCLRRRDFNWWKFITGV